MSVPGGLSKSPMPGASGSSKEERTKVRTLWTMASSTERTCSTLAPSEAISSISSKETAAEAPGLRLDARVGGVDAVDVGVDVAAIGLDRRGHRDGRGVRTAAPERGDAVVGRDALEAGEHRHLALGEAPDDLGGVDLLDAGGAMGAVGADRHLPALPGARVDAHRLQRDRQEPAVTCSPDATTASYSRASWIGEASRHQPTSSLVLPDIAETTTATSWPASTSRFT